MRKRPIVEIEDMDEPFCGIRRKNLVPLADAHPEVAEEWCYAKNGGWGPEHVTRASGVRAWWKCSRCRRDYKAQIGNRTSRQKSACPYCASKKVCEDNALPVFFPDVAREWHPTKNKKLIAADVTKASAKHAWFLCSKCNHSWKCAVSDRTTLGSGCPACYEARMEYARLHPSTHVTPQLILNSESKLSSWYEKPSSQNFVSLYEFSKTIARQWHPTKNGDIRAHHISKSSDAIAWWKCNKGPDHEWQAAVYSRSKVTKKGRCPFCTNLKRSVTNNLQAKSPALAKEWHPIKNGKVRPGDVIAGGNQKYWWQCKKDKSHEWEQKIYLRLNGRGCPYCSNRRVSKDNCLNKDFPYLAAQLHPTKNGDLNGDSIYAQSSINVWWVCKKGPDHEWQSSPASRTINGSGCPACIGRKRSITNSLATLNPDIAKLWHPKKNKGLRPEDVSPHSKMKAWWLCPQGHAFEQVITKRVTALIACRRCRHISAQNKIRPKYQHIEIEDVQKPFCGTQRDKRVTLKDGYPDIAAQWCYKKNAGWGPEHFNQTSAVKVWWICSDCSREYKSLIGNRTSRNAGCPFCTGKLVSKENSLASLYPKLAKQWHADKNESLTPEDVLHGSSKKVWWKCSKGPDHEWQSAVMTRTRKNGGGCPFCRGLRASVTNSLESLYPQIAKQWHPTKNKGLSPNEVTRGSNKSVWWKCDYNHSWQAIINDRTKRLSGCHVCRFGK